MGYFRNLASAFVGKQPKAAATFDMANMTPEQMREFLRIGGSMETASGVVITESSALKVAAAWRCVNILSGTIGSLPVDLIKRVSETERQPAAGHPLRRVLTVKPNQWQTPTEFRRMMMAHLLLRGNAYALKVVANGSVLGLIPLHPDKVTVSQRDDYSITYRVAMRGGVTKDFGQSEIFHLRGMSLDGITGLSVLSHMRESLGLAIKAEQAGAELMKNGQLVGGVLKHPGKLSAEAFARLKASMDERRSGGSAAGSNYLLEEGMDFAPVSMTALDMQFLQQRDFQRYDIAMYFGVPPHMIGATEKTTSWGSGIEQQGIGFVTYTLSDWIKVWEDAIKRDLLLEREWDTLDARFFTQGLMRGDAKARWESYVRGLQWGVISPNEVRAFEDMNPRDGGDVFYPPPNTAGQMESQPNEPETPPPAEGV